MEKVFIFLKLFVSLLFYVAFALGAESGTSKKIAFINEYALEDKNGVKRLYFAYNQMGMLDCVPSPCNQKTRDQWESMLVAPVLKEIEEALKQVETVNNLVVLRIGKLDNEGQLLALNKSFDITERFTIFFNNKPKESGKKLKLDLPNPKIGVINTELFYDKGTGIKKLAEAPGFNPKKACAIEAICVEIVKSIQDYATARSFSFILDLSKGLPREISEFETEDITANFITEYNKNKP